MDSYLLFVCFTIKEQCVPRCEVGEKKGATVVPSSIGVSKAVEVCNLPGVGPDLGYMGFYRKLVEWSPLAE